MPNFKQATKKSIHESKVQSLDNYGSSPDKFVERVVNNIDSIPNFVTTGAINDISIEAKDGRVNVSAAKHIIYQDRGVNGAKKKLYDTPHAYTDKKPPVDVFKAWIKDKKIRLEDNEKYYGKSPFKELTEDEQITRAAWAMSTKVFNEGFKPRKIYSKEIPQLVEDLGEQVADFVAQQVVNFIDVKPNAKRQILK